MSLRSEIRAICITVTKIKFLFRVPKKLQILFTCIYSYKRATSKLYCKRIEKWPRSLLQALLTQTLQ